MTDEATKTTEPGTLRPRSVAPRPGDPAITPEVVDDHGLSPSEYERLEGIMGRPPTFTELG
ncbi:MAG: hypothetical protein KY453_12220, partial [Gemmatimonadetes bacterium]|nr:hypothetical protein [Gemmatimonadota bacterium]